MSDTGDMSQSQKAVRYEQTIRALREMIDTMRSDNQTAFSRMTTTVESDVLAQYAARPALDIAERAIRLHAFDDILNMMTR